MRGDLRRSLGKRGVVRCGIGGSTVQEPQPKGRASKLTAHRARIRAHGACPDLGKPGHLCPVKH